MKYLLFISLFLLSFPLCAQHKITVVTDSAGVNVPRTFNMKLETIHCDVRDCKREGVFFESQYIPCSGYISMWYCKRHYRRIKR